MAGSPAYSTGDRDSVSALPDEVQVEVARMLAFAGIEQPPIQLTPEDEADLAGPTPRSNGAMCDGRRGPSHVGEDHL